MHEITISWCKSYLSNRSFRVKVDDCLSESYPAPTGVPQGSCLSPLLYTIFISDISLFLPKSVKYLLFADDLKIYCPILSEASHTLLQSAVDGVSRWCRQNGMLLSPSKCVVLKHGFNYLDYFLSGSVLPSSTITRDLGVLVSPSLDFSDHISQTIRSASIMIGTIFRCFSTKSPFVYIHLYKSLVITKFIYCAPVWKPHLRKHLLALNKVHSKFIDRLRWRCDLQKSFDLSLIPTVTETIDTQDVKALSILNRANLLSYFFNTSSNNLRSIFTVRPKHLPRTEKIRNMFSWRMAKWICENGVPHELVLSMM